MWVPFSTYIHHIVSTISSCEPPLLNQASLLLSARFMQLLVFLWGTQMFLRVSQLHIRSGFSVYTRPSEQCGTLASAPLHCGLKAQTQKPLSHFSHSSFTSCTDPYPGWHDLCLMWAAGLLNSRTNLRPTTTMPSQHWNTISLHNITSSVCAQGDTL